MHRSFFWQIRRLPRHHRMFIKHIYKTILKRKIDRVNRHLGAINFDEPEFQEMYDWSVNASGMRFRPLLVMIACEAVGGDSRRIVPIASSFELLHKASLIHDDLIDGDDFRRGVEAFHHKYTRAKAVVMGDLLVSLAFEGLFESRDILGDRFLDAWQTLITTYKTLSLGEIREEVFRDRDHVELNEIEKLHYQKTAVLIESCFRVGALSGGGTDEETAALADFGRYTGLIFQIINDINNITGLETEVKKELYADLRQTKKNYMVVHAMRESSSESRVQLAAILQGDELDEGDVDILRDAIAQSHSIEYAHSLIDDYMLKAKDALATIRDGGPKSMLLKLVDEAREKWFWQAH